MSGDWGLVGWLLLLSVPVGLTLGGFWARGWRRRRSPPKVPPGGPGNPV